MFINVHGRLVFLSVSDRCIPLSRTLKIFQHPVDFFLLSRTFGRPTVFLFYSLFNLKNSRFILYSTLCNDFSLICAERYFLIFFTKRKSSEKKGKKFQKLGSESKVALA